MNAKPLQSLARGLRRAGLAALATLALQAQAGIAGLWGSAGADAAPGAARSFSLIAADGHINAADGVQIYMWGYGDAARGRMQYIGPTLKVKEGDTVTVSLENRLPVRTSILFPGQAGVQASGGSPGVLTTEAAPTQTVTYTFTASHPGTYLYQSGTQPGLQVEMGLVGALIVYPATAGTAYNHASTAYDRETLLVSSEADSKLHQSVYEQVQAFRAANPAPDAEGSFSADLAHRFPDYWFLNGRTSPDVFADNEVGELPLQPYNCLPRVHPGEKILFRMAGAGTDLHPMHHHGNNSWAIARDGRMLSSNAATLGANLAVSDYTIPVVPGETYDAIWTWTGKHLGWDVFGATCNAAQPVSPQNCRFGKYNASGVQTSPPAIVPGSSPPRPYTSTQDPVADMYKPIPVRLPTPLELSYGEFYSGSPYLGDFGVRPVGTGFANTSAAFFHMFHSHNEREVVNGGIYPGGMLTMIVVEPFSVDIND